MRTTDRSLTARTFAHLSAMARSSSGVASVELAFIMPFAMVVVIGLIDYGLGIHRNMEISNAARAGTQYAVIRKPIQGNTQEIVEAVNQASPPQNSANRSVIATLYCECPDGSEIACSSTCPDGGYRSAFVEVTVGEDYHTILHYPMFDSPIRLESHAVVRLN